MCNKSDRFPKNQKLTLSFFKDVLQSNLKTHLISHKVLLVGELSDVDVYHPIAAVLVARVKEVIAHVEKFFDVVGEFIVEERISVPDFVEND